MGRAVSDNVTTGVVFDIREFTVHDGPGLRTTVFLKGCPLHCAWCHNPEGISPAPQVMRGAAGERTVGREYRADELADILNRQAPVLREGGGVTFSGGEPLAQAAFVAEVIDRLEHLHVVLDTSGHAPTMHFRHVVMRSDLVLFDLKLADPQEHLRWTGVDNALILANLRLLSGLGTPFIVRVPLVPGVTNTEQNLRAIVRIADSLHGLVRVELLPYNQAAGGKYAACGLEWRPAFDETRPVHVDPAWFADTDSEVVLL